jgi:hypothetical protein
LYKNVDARNFAVVTAVKWSDISNIIVAKERPSNVGLLTVDYTVLRNIFHFLMPVQSFQI